MDNVYIVGVGMIRFGKYPQGTVRGMANEAVQLVLDDAGLEKDDIQAAYVSNTFWGMFSNQHSIRGEVMLWDVGLKGIPIVNCENACAGASTALHLGYMAVRSGMYDVVMALGSEKITHENKALSLSAYATCMDVENFESHINMFMELNKKLDFRLPDGETPPGEGRSIFMDAYAMGARWHMKTFGTTQRQLAAICAKNHWHGSMNPKAQYQENMTVEDVLAAKPVTYPLTRPMCAPVGDGAAAAILCSENYLKKLSGARPVRIRASVLGSGTDRDLDGVDIGERLSKQAYEIAGLGPDGIDLAELHDATAYGELHQYEAMGFCPLGEGGPFAESGATRLGGAIPVNTSGGLECRGHPIGASGLAQIHEVVCQLRGEAGKRQVKGARIGLTENGGGNLGVEEASMTIHILEKV
ncbi:MAG TPA: thiolase family protein [Deltaproteobacteria bacterium]|jgi:acetyl-CoA acetyltransferase|nr:thiolase family protein [Deltaproteobacteria bacterium]HOE72736.1 thiolase family protein [Deltaproteobacteria bacterium]HOS28759.1 thiolase family protein [Deltaproteobacteria bacterium]HPA84341.1 thiolase family protein [Deltaproteobacteria bacterium]HPL88180.1 thiolase family protein [Deltaproteobacteria bacterium]